MIALTKKGEAYAARQELRRALPKGVTLSQWRKHAEGLLERLQDAQQAIIDQLDALDGDSDDEPSLATPEPHYATAAYWNGIWPTERPFSPAMPIGSQTSLSRGNRSDLEDEHDGTEPENEHGGDINDEPHDGYLDEFEGLGDEDLELAEPTVFNPQGAHLAGGGSGI